MADGTMVDDCGAWLWHSGEAGVGVCRWTTSKLMTRMPANPKCSTGNFLINNGRMQPPHRHTGVAARQVTARPVPLARDDHSTHTKRNESPCPYGTMLAEVYGREGKANGKGEEKGRQGQGAAEGEGSAHS